MGKKDTRLFTKIRNEFNDWSKLIEKSFQMGEAGCRPEPAFWAEAAARGGGGRRR